MKRGISLILCLMMLLSCIYINAEDKVIKANTAFDLSGASKFMEFTRLHILRLKLNEAKIETPAKTKAKITKASMAQRLATCHWVSSKSV